MGVAGTRAKFVRLGKRVRQPNHSLGHNRLDADALVTTAISSAISPPLRLYRMWAGRLQILN
jgi:hypothetical protein